MVFNATFNNILSGRDRIGVEFKTTYAIITDVVSLNLDQVEMYNIM
jgi:hypothetical protein